MGLKLPFGKKQFTRFFSRFRKIEGPVGNLRGSKAFIAAVLRRSAPSEPPLHPPRLAAGGREGVLLTGWGKCLVNHISNDESAALIRRRCFFHVSGFDQCDAAAQYRRFVREIARFAATWNVKAEVSAPPPFQHPQAADGGKGGDGESRWTVTTQGPAWRVVTVFELLDWSDIVRGEVERPSSRKLYEGLATFAELICSGTAWRYFTANWRYGMFFLVPFLNIFLFAALAILAACYAGAGVAAVLASTLWGAAAVPAAAAFAFAVLMRWPGKRWRVPEALADWIFAREYMLGRHPEMNARIEAFAARVAACARRADVQEIVVAGHSLGATVAVDVLARVFARDPTLRRRGPKLNLLTVGATIPKLALHPRGAWLRESARRLAAEPSLTWAEYQARDDFISFHKFDPVKLARVPSPDAPPSPRASRPLFDRGMPDRSVFASKAGGTPALSGEARAGADGGPIIRRVQIHQMLSAPTLRRLRFSYMRLHYQFVMANERRSPYDYFMLMCGPAPFRLTVNQPDGPADLYDADGAYVAGAPPVAVCAAG